MTTPAPKTVNMKCRNPKCTSIVAAEIPMKDPTVRMYYCVKCNYSWGAAVGGTFNLGSQS